MLQFPPPFTIVCQQLATFAKARTIGHVNSVSQEAFDRVSDVIDRQVERDCV